MAKQTAKSAITDLQSLFDPKGYEDVFNTWTGLGERLSGIALETASTSTDIATASTHETLSNLRTVMTARTAPADYMQAYADFVQKQMDLVGRTAQSFAEVTQKAGADATELASKTGEQMGEKVTSNVNAAAEKATSAAKTAAA